MEQDRAREMHMAFKALIDHLYDESTKDITIVYGNTAYQDPDIRALNSMISKTLVQPIVSDERMVNARDLEAVKMVDQELTIMKLPFKIMVMPRERYPENIVNDVIYRVHQYESSDEFNKFFKVDFDDEYSTIQTNITTLCRYMTGWSADDAKFECSLEREFRVFTYLWNISQGPFFPNHPDVVYNREEINMLCQRAGIPFYIRACRFTDDEVYKVMLCNNS